MCNGTVVSNRNSASANMDTLRFLLRGNSFLNRTLVAYHRCLHAKACAKLPLPPVDIHEDNSFTNTSYRQAVCCATKNAGQPAATENPQEQPSRCGSHDASSTRDVLESPFFDGRTYGFLPDAIATRSILGSLENEVAPSSPQNSLDGDERRVRARSLPAVAIPARVSPHRIPFQTIADPYVMQRCHLNSFSTTPVGVPTAPTTVIDSTNKRQQKTLTGKERMRKNGKNEGTAKVLQQELAAQRQQQQQAQQHGQQQEQVKQEIKKRKKVKKKPGQLLPPKQAQEQLPDEPPDHPVQTQQQERAEEERNAIGMEQQQQQLQDKVATETEAPPVYVLWDLDNKYPVHLDHGQVVTNIRSLLRPYGKVMDIKAFCNYQTLNYVPELWADAMEMGMVHPLKALDEIDRSCPMCGRRFSDPIKLAHHFKQLHEREHMKKFAHAPTAKKYVLSAKFLKFKQARGVAMYKKRGFDLEGILREAGVQVTRVPLGPQRADTALEKEAMQLLRQVPVPEAGKSYGGQPMLCVVSDDHGFEHILKLFSRRGWKTIVMGSTRFKNADVQIDWNTVADSGDD